MPEKMENINENVEREIVTLINPDGEEVQAEVLIFFELESNQKEYLIYTYNEKDKNNMVTVYASAFVEDNGKFCLRPIETDEEWAMLSDVLDEYMDDEEIGLTDEQYNDYIPGYLNEGKQFGDGKMYMIPWSKSTEILYYNADVFAKHNLTVPTHWFSTSESDTTSMEYVCKTLKTLYPKSIPLGYDSESNFFITQCEQLGLPYTSATGENFLFNTNEHKDLMKKFKGWYNNGWLTT